MEPTEDEWRDRALAAESDLAALRSGVREYIIWLQEPDRGPVLFRSEAAEHLKLLLDM